MRGAADTVLLKRVRQPLEGAYHQDFRQPFDQVEDFGSRVGERFGPREVRSGAQALMRTHADRIQPGIQ